MYLALVKAKVPKKVYFSILLLPVGFLLASTPMLLISINFNNGITLSWRPDQLSVAAALVTRAAGATSCLVLLILTTPVHAIIPILGRLGIPTFLIEIILLTYRLIFVFAETALRGYQAQTARLGYSSWRQSVSSLGNLSAALFQRSMERARHLEIGLSARGFDGNLPILSDEASPISLPRCLLIIISLGCILSSGIYMETVFHV